MKANADFSNISASADSLARKYKLTGKTICRQRLRALGKAIQDTGLKSGVYEYHRNYAMLTNPKNMQLGSSTKPKSNPLSSSTLSTFILLPYFYRHYIQRYTE